MAKQSKSKSDRLDPKKNKSLAIRNVLKKMSKAKASEVVKVVKKEYGHDVHPNMVYMVKTKANVRKAKGPTTSKQGSTMESPMTTAVLWVEAIHLARHLLKATGSLANATALLQAVDG